MSYQSLVARALANAFAERWHGHEEELAHSTAARREIAGARERGDYDTAVVYAGQGVGSLSRERAARDVITEVAEGAESLLRRW